MGQKDDVWESQEEIDEIVARQEQQKRTQAKGHRELISDDGTTQVYRWVSDE